MLRKILIEFRGLEQHPTRSNISISGEPRIAETSYRLGLELLQVAQFVLLLNWQESQM